MWHAGEKQEHSLAFTSALTEIDYHSCNFWSSPERDSWPGLLRFACQKRMKAVCSSQHLAFGSAFARKAPTTCTHHPVRAPCKTMYIVVARVKVHFCKHHKPCLRLAWSVLNQGVGSSWWLVNTTSVQMNARPLSFNSVLVSKCIWKYWLVLYYASWCFTGIECDGPYWDSEGKAPATQIWHRWWCIDAWYLGAVTKHIAA